MWFRIRIFVLFLNEAVSGFDENAISCSIDYFKYREVKFVCLLTCDDNYIWNRKFTKVASLYSLAVSQVNLNDNFNDFIKISKCLHQKLFSVGVLIDSSCPKCEEIMQFASENMMFDAMHKWVAVDNYIGPTHLNESADDFNEEYNNTADNTDVKQINGFLTDSYTLLNNLNTSVDSDIVLLTQKDSLDIDLYEAFNFGKIQGGNLNINKIGSWNEVTGLALDVNLNEYKYYRRWNFQQWKMRMVVVMSKPPKNFDPEIIIGEKPSPDVAHITRAPSMALSEIAKMHNFTYIYTISDRWISSFSRANSKVVATSLYLRDQDITPILRCIPEIQGKLDLVHPPLASIETKYYYRIPTKGPGKLENQFLRPLTTGAWIAVVVVILLCAVLLLLSAKQERRPMAGQYAVFSVLASFCQQFFEDSEDQQIRRSSNARKISALVTGLSCVLIYNYYTSSVVSWLLNGPPPSINSLQELLESPLDLIYEDIGYTRSWLQDLSYNYNKRNAKIEDEMRRRKVYKKKSGDHLLVPVEDGIEMVKAGGYAYHTEANTANKLISRKFTQSELCELGSLQSMDLTVLYPAVQKDSPYREFFVWSTSRLKERGIVSCIQHRTSSDSVSCEGSSPRALALGGAAPAFLLLAFGYVLATFILFAERFHHKLLGSTKHIIEE